MFLLALLDFLLIPQVVFLLALQDLLLILQVVFLFVLPVFFLFLLGHVLPHRVVLQNLLPLQVPLQLRLRFALLRFKHCRHRALVLADMRDALVHLRNESGNVCRSAVARLLIGVLACIPLRGAALCELPVLPCKVGVRRCLEYFKLLLQLSELIRITVIGDFDSGHAIERTLHRSVFRGAAEELVLPHTGRLQLRHPLVIVAVDQLAGDVHIRFCIQTLIHIGRLSHKDHRAVSVAVDGNMIGLIIEWRIITRHKAKPCQRSGHSVLLCCHDTDVYVTAEVHQGTVRPGFPLSRFDRRHKRICQFAAVKHSIIGVGHK